MLSIKFRLTYGTVHIYFMFAKLFNFFQATTLVKCLINDRKHQMVLYLILVQTFFILLLRKRFPKPCFNHQACLNTEIQIYKHMNNVKLTYDDDRMHFSFSPKERSNLYDN